MGPRAGLDGCEKSRPPTGFDPRTFQPVRVTTPTERSRPATYPVHLILRDFIALVKEVE